jgi:hypothetical protein
MTGPRPVRVVLPRKKIYLRTLPFRLSSVRVDSAPIFFHSYFTHAL